MPKKIPRFCKDSRMHKQHAKNLPVQQKKRKKNHRTETAVNRLIAYGFLEFSKSAKLQLNNRRRK